MIVLPANLDLTADQAALEAKIARERLDRRGDILLRYLNQIRAAHELGENSLTTTCLAHEIDWISRELRERGFEVASEVHLMHGQLTIRWPERP
ncbi:MAG: hypothetical protein DVB23_003029 [Verrucomicrobia bacterium]|jgi:hypothetical protein|nr:MAG: hypothetical protein DVB23_003029 [Verrucomicrobiota bacterium]